MRELKGPNTSRAFNSTFCCQISAITSPQSFLPSRKLNFLKLKVPNLVRKKEREREAPKLANSF